MVEAKGELPGVHARTEVWIVKVSGMLRRGVTSVQIARATEAERAEARSLSADRRHKLRLHLGESEGVSKLLENSLLGAEGVPPPNPAAHELFTAVL